MDGCMAAVQPLQQEIIVMNKCIVTVIGLNGAFLGAAGVVWGIPIALCGWLLSNCEIPFYGLTVAGIGIVLGFIPSIAIHLLHVFKSRRATIENEN